MSNTKSFDVLAVVERGKGKTYFTRIGAAFAAKDGEGFNISLDALPLNGSMLLRAPKAKADDNGGAR